MDPAPIPTTKTVETDKECKLTTSPPTPSLRIDYFAAEDASRLLLAALGAA